MGKCISKGNDSNNPPFKQDRENMAGKLKTLRFRNGRNEGYDFHQPKHEKQNHNISKIKEGTVARLVESFNLQDFKQRNENDKKRQRMSTGIGYNSSCINSVTSINSLPSINTVNKNESQLNVSGMEKGTGREPGASYYSKDSITSNDTAHIASLMENKSSYKDKVHYPTVRRNKSEQEGPIITHDLQMGKLTIFWKPFSKHAVQYQVCVYENDVYKYSEDTKRSPRCMHELKGGKAGKQYSFKIIPIDSFGDSSAFDYGPIKLQGAPSIPTGKIKIETKSQNSIRISWGNPENDGGCPLKGFIVEKQNRLNSDWKQCGEVNGSNLSVEIHDISPMEKYVFRVKAYNDIMEGDSLTSEEYIHRWNISNTDRPQEPLGPLTYTVIADGIVKLCWSQDECRDKHFTKIKVQQSLSDSSAFTDAKTENIERNNCLVTFLRLDQKYKFRVAGVGSDETVGYWLTSGFDPVIPRLEKPNPPSCLKICYTGEQDEKAYVRWNESDTNGYMVSSYIVQMKIVKEEEWLIIANDVENNSVNCPFHFMENHKKYHFQVVAKNIKGFSSPSETSEEVIKKSVPSPPTNLNCEIQTKYILLKWNAPESDGGYPILHYYLKPKNDKQIKLAANLNEHKIENLFDNSAIEFAVIAQNVKGESEEAFFFFKEEENTYDRPQEPLGPLTYTVVADGSVMLYWSQDECRDKQFIKIRIEQSVSDSYTFSEAKTQYIGRNSCLVTSLRLDQEYNFRVAGVRSDETIGYWLTGEFDPVIPRLEKPNPPSCLKFCYIGDQEEQAYVQWKESDTNGYMVSSYIVQMKLVKDEAWLIIAYDVKNNSVACPFHLMENHKKYHFQVVAKNIKGVSSQSETSEEIIKKAVPSPPKNLNCDIKTKYVLLKWNAPESDGGYPILHYYLKLRNEKWIKLPANIYEHTVKNCFDNSTVEFAVIAQNVKGESEESFFSFKEEENTYERSVTNEVTEKRHISKVQITLRPSYSIIKGLPNVGMTCYANCIFQILGQTPGLLQHLKNLLQNNRYLDRELSVVSMLIRLITDLNRTDEENYSSIVNFYSVTSLIDVICLSDNSFARGEQNDCHSFIMALFNTVKNEIKTQDRSRSRNRETSGRRVKSADRLLDKHGNQAVHSLQKRSQSNRRLTKEDEDFGGPHIDANMKTINIEKESPLYMFEGYLSRRFTYEPCGHDEYSDKQLFTSILVPVKDHMIFNWSVEEGLDLLCTTEEFDGNDLPCTLCSNEAATKSQKQENRTQKKKTTKSKQIFTALPNILIVQIGKFREHGTRLEKMHKLVKYKEYLHVTETCVSEKQQIKEIKKKYMLYGVALHSGTINFGHYYAYVRKNSCDTTEGSRFWYECNDSLVFPVSPKDVLNDPKAFLLFYKSEKN